MMNSELAETDSPAAPMTAENHFDVETASSDRKASKCSKLCRSFSTRHNPLPANASCLQRLTFAFRCPTHGQVGWVLTGVVCGLCLYALFFVLLDHEDVLPGSCTSVTEANASADVNGTADAFLFRKKKCTGGIFGLYALFVLSLLGGIMVKRFLPPLLGMMIVGFLLANVPYVNVAQTINPKLSTLLRNVALCVILLRAGLGLNPQSLRKLSCAVVRLAFLPCLTEATVCGVVSRYLLDLPFKWGFMLGFVLAAVSPAVVVPCMLRLKQRRLGTDKGIPTLVIAAASIDDVLAITGFGVLLGMTFSQSEIVFTIFRGPLEALLGVTYGVVFGAMLWCIPFRQSRHFVFFRFFLLFGFGLFALLGSVIAEVPGAGALACLTIALVAGAGWTRWDDWTEDNHPLKEPMVMLWRIFQPFLFGLIGAEMVLEKIDATHVFWGLLALFIGLCFRMVASFLAVLGTNLNLRERLFISVAWLPKATVQAAIGPVALDTAKKSNNLSEVSRGLTILTCAVLAIIITAPLGALLIELMAPRLLQKEDRSLSLRKDEKCEDEEY